MSYSPPVGTAGLSLGSHYRQTVGVPELHLDLPDVDRDAAIAATTVHVTAQVTIQAFLATVTARTLPVQAGIALRPQFYQTVAATVPPGLGAGTRRL